MTVASTTTGLPGSNAAVSLSGTAFTFTIPRGETGPQGIQGVQGVQGTQGIQGPTGPDGASSNVNITGNWTVPTPAL